MHGQPEPGENSLEASVRRSVETEPRDLVVSTGEGRYLVLVLPLPGEEDGFDHPWKKTFLEWLQKGRTIETAAHLAGVSPRHVYRQRDSDELFRIACDRVRKKWKRKNQ